MKSLWASPRYAEMMINYKKQFTAEPQTQRIRTDYWNSDLYFNTFRSKGLLTQITDMGFLLTADGLSLFKIGSFEVWPIFLINLNLPPLERVKEDNIIPVGFVPGRKAPVDIESFLRPLVDELAVRFEGYQDVFNGYTKETFTLQGNVVLVSGDIPAMSKLMAMKGCNAYSCCRYCKIRGIYCKRRRHIYCPLKPPTQRENLSPDHEYPEYDPRNLPRRQHNEFIKQAVQITDEMNPELATLWGINHLSILAEIPTLDFPRSFVIDIMHLFYEGLSRIMLSHWMGDFFPKTMDLPVDTDHVLSSKQWEEIGRQMEQSKFTFPTSFGKAPRDISKYHNSFQASEWMNWLTVFSPLMLKDLAGLDAEYYQQWISMCDAMTLCRQWELTEEQIDIIEEKIACFVEYYEKVHYAYDANKMSACRATIHYLLHLGQCIRDCGPPGIYWQYPTERMCGFLTQKVKSRVSANRNLSLALLHKEQLHLIQLLYPEVTYTNSLIDRESIVEREVEATPGSNLGLHLGSNGGANLNPTLTGVNPTRLKSTPEMLSQGISLIHFHHRPPKDIVMTSNERIRIREFYERLLQGRRINEQEEATFSHNRMRLQRYSHCSFPGFKVTSQHAQASYTTREGFLISYVTMQGQTRFGAVIYFTCVKVSERCGEQLLAFIRILKTGHTRGERFVWKDGEGATEFIRVDSIKMLVCLICKDNKLWFAHRSSSLLLPGGL